MAKVRFYITGIAPGQEHMPPKPDGTPFSTTDAIWHEAAGNKLFMTNENNEIFPSGYYEHFELTVSEETPRQLTFQREMADVSGGFVAEDTPPL